MRLLVVLAALLVLTACGDAGGAGEGSGAGSGAAAPAPDESSATAVVGLGTVIDTGEGPEICLGPITMVAPPTCRGPRVLGWDWDAAESEQTMDGVTWGSYAVTGTWDGDALTVTEPPILSALYDPAPAPTPSLPPAPDLTAAALQQVADDVTARADDLGVLGAVVTDGRVEVDVVFDDGTLQQRLDDEHGAGAVVVRSALRPVGE